MDQKSRVRLKGVLACIAVALLSMQLLSMVGQQRNEVLPTIMTTQSARSIPVDTTVCTTTVRAVQLNQRSGPGESYPLTGAVSKGDGFAVRAWDETRQWLLVSTSYGSAWMSARYTILSGNCNKLPVYNMVNNPSDAAKVSSPDTSTPEPVVQQAATKSSSMGAVVTPLSSVFTPEVQYWKPEITAWATPYQIDPNLIATVIQIESCGDPSVHSTAGAQGLFQVMPFHFAVGENMLDVQTNARRGLAYLQGALKLAQGDVGQALAGYNGGYGVINGNWSSETQRYSYWGSGIYAEAVSGTAVSPTLQKWLAAGGSTLCASASKSQRLMD